jgi:2-isopropylmalate synthase
MRIARALEEAGVDVIELASTADDDESFANSKRIAGSLERATVCCIAPIGEADLEKAFAFLDGLARPRIHLYLDARRIRALEADADLRERTFASMAAIIGRARTEFAEVEFSPQDATRTDTRTLAGLLQVALDAGATIINISDTTGTATPREIGDLFDSLSASLADYDPPCWSLHGHNHRGRAAQNALAALQRGVLQIEGTINGVGPAGGNANLIEVAETIKADEMLGDRLAHIGLRRLRKIGSQSGLREFL